MYTINITKAQLNILREVLKARQIEGSYYGNSVKYYKNVDIILNKIEQAEQFGIKL